VAQTDPRAVRRPQQVEIPCRGGLFSSPSRFQAPLGTLSNVRNFEVVDDTYEESQGLTIVGPSLDDGLTRFWHADLPSGDTTIAGTWSKGDFIYWYGPDGVSEAGSARIYYVDMSGSNRILTIDKITGRVPRRSTKFYTSSGATLEVTGNSAQDDVFIYQANLNISWDDYEGPKFLGSLLTAQAETSTTWDAIKPDPLGVGGISGLFQLNDSVYAVRDFFGGRFVSGQNEPAIGDAISVNNGAVLGTFTARVAGYELTSGSWEENDAAGYLYLYPDSGTSLDMDESDNWADSTTVTNTTQSNTLATTVATGARTYQNKGLIWKKDKDSLQGGWKYIDMGHSVAFDSGLVAPNAEQAPLIKTDSLESVLDTGSLDCNSPATEYPSTGTYSSWTGLSNLQAGSPSTYASTTIQTEDYSRVLELNLKDGGSDVLDGDARILGIEITVKAHQTVGTDAYFNQVVIRNDASGAEQYLSTNYGGSQFLDTSTSTTYTFGGQLDTWGLDEIKQEDLNNGDLVLLLQFGNSNASSTRVVNADQVSVKVHYALTSQKLYFYDGTSDVANGNLFSYQLEDGEWSSDDAQGWMTLHGLTAPGSVKAGHEIRTAASGGGSLIATVRSVSTNLLPSLEEIDTAKTMYQYRVGTFSGNEDTEAAYVANGAGPAFMLNRDDKFAFIRTPVDEKLDKPTFVEIHRAHLLLAIGSHLLISSVGAPTNFSTYDGATTWSLRDKISGLASAASGTTLIACEDSIHYLQGSGATGQDSFAVRLVTDHGGALPYTIIPLLGIIYVDHAGFSTAAISDKFGGFDLGRRTGHLRDIVQEQLNKSSSSGLIGNHVVGAMPVRRKNQYRVYLSDGTILTATFPENPQDILSVTMQHYAAYYEDDSRGYDNTFVPTCLSSEVLSTGEERVLIGTRLGHVFRVDPQYLEVLSYASRDIAGPERKTNLQTWAPHKFIDFNPIHSKDPAQSVKFTSCDVFLEHSGYVDLNRVWKSDYGKFLAPPDANDLENTVGNTVMVGSRDSYPGVKVDDYFTWYLDVLTDGLSVRLSKFGGQGAVPARIPQINVDVTPRGVKHDRIHESRAYEISSISPAFDLLVEGQTVGLTITEPLATLGNWRFDASFTLDEDDYRFDGWYV
jgi:hypothetical protein